MRIISFLNELPSSISFKSNNAQDISIFWKDNYSTLNNIKILEDNISGFINTNDTNQLIAFSESACHEVSFNVFSRGIINWREDIICPVSNLNNRARASITVLQQICGITPNTSIYLTEQTTPTWEWFEKNYKYSVGSEYLGSKSILGSIHNGIRNEDLTNLSFDSESFDCIVSFDCLEHIPNYQRAISEIYRTLKYRGRVLLTFPFTGQDETIVRAIIDSDGNIIHNFPPEYHGDPVNASQGILCYYHFGYDILRLLKDVGFKEAFVYWFWSASRGNLGGLQPYIVAYKF